MGSFGKAADLFSAAFLWYFRFGSLSGWVVDFVDESAAHSLHVIGQRRGKPHFLPAGGMQYSQHHSVEAQPGRQSLGTGGCVPIITQNGHAIFGKVNPHLMGASCLQLGFQQVDAPIQSLELCEVRDGAFGVLWGWALATASESVSPVFQQMAVHPP